MAPQNLMNKKIKLKPFYESSVYMGSFDNKLNATFSEQDLFEFISGLQDSYEIIIPVRISPTTYLSGSDYKERGWKISAIDYPPLETSPKIVNDFMIHLGEGLLERFSQHKISVVTPENTITIESDDSET